MRPRVKFHQIPPRLATGAFILNSGLGKLKADEQTQQWLHGAATTAYPFFSKLDAKTFTRMLAIGEVALGSALVLPVVPTVVAGAMLTGFGGALTGLYLQTPGMTESDGIRPTQDGLTMAKDTWLLGIGLGLFLDGALHGRRRVKVQVPETADIAVTQAPR